MNCVEFEEFCRKWIDGSWKCQADETQSRCKQNSPLLRPSQTEGHPGLCAQRRKCGPPATYRVSFEPAAFACA